MATILIEHPEHGRMHVYTQDELKRHEGMGWREVKNSAPPARNVTQIPQRRARK